MPSLSFQPVTLDSGHDDNRAMLVFRDDRLFAVITALSDLHQDMAGSWFVETLFHGQVRAPHEPFASLDGVEAWVVDAEDR